MLSIRTHDLVPFKQWCYETAEALGICVDTLHSRLYAGWIDYPRAHRINRRVILVESSAPTGRMFPRPGEIPIAQFISAEAARYGLSPAAIYNRLARGHYPGITIRKVSRKYAFVSGPAHYIGQPWTRRINNTPDHHETHRSQPPPTALHLA